MKNSKIALIIILAILLIVLVIAGYKIKPQNNKDNNLISNKPTQMSLVITSPYFKDWERIPPQFTCDGADVFPDLAIKNLPAETKALAISVEDPDAPFKTFIHLVSIIPFATDQITQQTLDQSILGLNDFWALGRRGPCPPPGDKPHRYFFKVWALGNIPMLQSGFDYEQFVSTINSSEILNQGQLIWTYSRTNK